jgi:hypothetical protein
MTTIVFAQFQDACKPNHECCQVETTSCCLPEAAVPASHSDFSGRDCSCTHGGPSNALRTITPQRAGDHEERSRGEVASDPFVSIIPKPALLHRLSVDPAPDAGIAVFRLTSRWRC